jgi:endonuclease/exonuclease/phosphatase family metal-dependent hydrolase
MDITLKLYGIVALIAPHAGILAGADGKVATAPSAPYEAAAAIWAKIKPKMKGRQSIKEAISDLAEDPMDEDARAALRLQLKKLLQHDETLSGEIETLWDDACTRGLAPNMDEQAGRARWLDVLEPGNDALGRLEMVRLLRTGTPPHEIAARFKTDLKYIFRVHSAFSLNGVAGIVSGSSLRCWMDSLNAEDPILRRLDMVRLLRSGAPAETVAAEYNTTKEYIYRLSERFSKDGVPGILCDDDVNKFRRIHPKVIRICSFNLHGVHDGDPLRYKRIANELAVFDPELVAFQEVISGGGIEDTAAQIAKHLSGVTGDYYRSHFANCHLYMEKYPEGVSVCAKSHLEKPQSIDLNKGLSGGLKPLMERFASACEVSIHDKRVVFACVHLDHDQNPKVRLAQAEKLLNEIDRIYCGGVIDSSAAPGVDSSATPGVNRGATPGVNRGSGLHATILAGDFNDSEDAPVMAYLREQGFQDAYRSLHHGGGATFPTVAPHARIDYIMVRGDVRVRAAELVLRDTGFSDHIGLYAVIE